MADPLSIASSITALMGLCGTIIKLVSTAKGASKYLRRIDIEVKAFSTVLEELKNDVSAGAKDAKSARSGVDAALEGCKTTLEELEKGLAGLSISSSGTSRSGKRRKLNDALKWPWKEADTKKLLTAIQEQKTTLITGVLGVCYGDIKDIKETLAAVQGSVNGLHKTTARALEDEERSKVVSWIQGDINPTSIQNKACSQREEDDHTGEWMMRMNMWHMWINSDTHMQPPSRLLWVHGIPGAGKTLFASFLIDQCSGKIRDAPPKTAQCIYYYCSYRNNRDESEPFLKWVVSQMCRGLRLVPSKILEQHDMNHHPSIAVLMDGLAELLDSINVLYIFVDGVDESQEPRDQFLNILVQLATSPRFRKIRLLATSRLYTNIRVRLEPCSMVVPMSNEEVNKDIRKFVRREITNTWKEPWKLELKDIVVEKLVAGAQGMFQWAACQVRILNRNRLRSKHDILRALEELPKDLDETYERMLREVPEEDRAVARDVFSWLHGHEKEHPLVEDGLPAAFLVRWMNLNKSSKVSESSYWRIADIEDICGCLITVFAVDSDADHSDPDPDSDSDAEEESRSVSRSEDYRDTVTFSHYTVLEYLLSDRVRERNDDVAFFAMTTEKCKSDHIRQVLKVITSLDPCLAVTPGFEVGWKYRHQDDVDRFDHYCVEVAIDGCWDAGATLIYDDLLAKINIPSLFRYAPYFCSEYSLVHWDGDPRTRDSVRLCDLVLNGWDQDHDGLVTRLIRENGSHNLFQNKIRGFGLTGNEWNLNSMDKFAKRVGWSQCFRESPLATTGIAILLSQMVLHSSPINGWELAFQELALFSLEYVDQATLLYTVIPLHFKGYTCCYDTQDNELCSLLTGVLKHRPAFDLNNMGYQITPLQLAVYCRNLDIARFLIKNAAHANAVGLKNGKPLPESTIRYTKYRRAGPRPPHSTFYETLITASENSNEGSKSMLISLGGKKKVNIGNILITKMIVNALTSSYWKMEL